MISRKKQIAIGIVIFLVGAVLTFPARVAYKWFVSDPISLSGLSGTIWNGKAVEGIADGVYFTNLQWTMKPLSLLRGVAAFDTSVDTAGGQVSMTAGLGLGGTVTLTDVVGSLSLASVHPTLQQNRISGLLNIQMQTIELSDGWPTLLVGSVGIGNLVAGAIGPDTLGNFRAEFSTVDGSINGLVEDVGAVLNVDGSIKLSEDRSYSLIGLVSANQDTPLIINQNLRFLGSPNTNGQRQFRFEGSL